MVVESRADGGGEGRRRRWSWSEDARTSVRISNAYLSTPAAAGAELSAGAAAAAAATPAVAGAAAVKRFMVEPRRSCFWACFLESAVGGFWVKFTCWAAEHISKALC